MITEQDRQVQDQGKIESGIRLCEDAMAKAEKYERLADNADWKGFWEDIRILGGIHEREIQMACAMMPDAPNTTYVNDGKAVSSKQDWADFIARHEAQRQEILNWLKEPERIMRLAAQARKTLPILREKLAGPKDAGKPVES